ncbi:hypothetical protein Vadar_017118 [Vaccinium darrowii]|uniref:Uncharacterized protein n=1 Tax=Vaccinium darrowii TaxID=229202 RepID=A0ACB7X1U1_9ERIC|nr:hypothetical protein Vadar_017118 [Vaccinium darrowii]
MAPKKKVAAQPKAVNDSRSSGNGGMVTRSTRSASTRQRVDESDELPKSKKPKSSTTSTKAKVKGKEPGTIATATAAAADVVAADGEKTKTVVIEHCKQCNSFKTRAVQVKNGLESGLPGITVLVNPEKPRRGCFEIREEGGGKFISLLDMKRPFTPMKALDMDEVIADVIEKIK